ncbi:MAG: peptide deformylase [Cyanobacteria bacterium P01_F01_bin.33]
MTCLPVAHIGDAILRDVALSVPVPLIPTASFQSFVADMVDTMRARDGVGIAAPQVCRSLRVIAVECRDRSRYPDAPLIPLQVWINPQILDHSQQRDVYSEGCLSVPDTRGDVWRPRHIHLRALNLQGQNVEFHASGFLARVLQHEIDHLNGVLFVDRFDNAATQF